MKNNVIIKGSLTFKGEDFDIELKDFETTFSSEMNERETNNTATCVSTILTALTSLLADNNKKIIAEDINADAEQNKRETIIEDFRETTKADEEVPSADDYIAGNCGDASRK